MASSCCATLTGVIGPSFGGELELGLVDVADENPGAAGGERGQRRHQADRPGADHQRDVARLDLRLGGGMHADGQRLDHRRLGEARRCPAA